MAALSASAGEGQARDHKAERRDLNGLMALFLRRGN
jgi:hypothetical protein